MGAAGFDRPTTWMVIAIAALVLFGYKKLPDMSRSVGRSLRIFKSEMKGLSDDETQRDSATQASPAAVPVNPAPATSVPPPSAETIAQPPAGQPPAAQVPVTQAPVVAAPVVQAPAVSVEQPQSVPPAQG